MVCDDDNNVVSTSDVKDKDKLKEIIDKVKENVDKNKKTVDENKEIIKSSENNIFITVILSKLLHSIQGQM